MLQRTRFGQVGGYRHDRGLAALSVAVRRLSETSDFGDDRAFGEQDPGSG